MAAHPAAVRFGDGRRPEQTTQVQVAEFDGPLALLLALIESRRLDVLTVPLGALADAYLDALARLTGGAWTSQNGAGRANSGTLKRPVFVREPLSSGS